MDQRVIFLSRVPNKFKRLICKILNSSLSRANHTLELCEMCDTYVLVPECDIHVSFVVRTTFELRVNDINPCLRCYDTHVYVFLVPYEVIHMRVWASSHLSRPLSRCHVTESRSTSCFGWLLSTVSILPSTIEE